MVPPLHDGPARPGLGRHSADLLRPEGARRHLLHPRSPEDYPDAGGRQRHRQQEAGEGQAEEGGDASPALPRAQDGGGGRGEGHLIRVLKFLRIQRARGSHPAFWLANVLCSQEEDRPPTDLLQYCRYIYSHTFSESVFGLFPSAAQALKYCRKYEPQP